MKLFVTTRIQSQSTACRKTNPNSPCPPASQPNQTLDNPVFESRRYASSISPMFHLEYRRYCAATSAMFKTHFTRYLFLTAFKSFSSNIGDVQNSFRPPVSCQAPKRPPPYPISTRTIHPFPVFSPLKRFSLPMGWPYTRDNKRTPLHRWSTAPTATYCTTERFNQYTLPVLYRTTLAAPARPLSTKQTSLSSTRA